VPHTGHIGAVKLLSVAGAYWRGDERNPMLQRIYGTSFATKEALEEHLKMVEQAKARDHRKLGKELELFMFHEYAPAMPFLLPRGAFVYNKLLAYMRELYVRYGYEEVHTPQVFDKRLFETSGHLPNYRENMYLPMTAEHLDEVRMALSVGVHQPNANVPADEGSTYEAKDKERDKAVIEQLAEMEKLGLKPMNCPSHCLIFGQRRRSYRELPLRIADFGRLHRYERSGVVQGLTRVRSFCQDDAHFRAQADMQAEIASLKLIRGVRLPVQASTAGHAPDKRIARRAVDAGEKFLPTRFVAANLSYETLRARARSTAPSGSFTSTTRWAAPGSSARCRSTSPCPRALAWNTWATTANGTRRSCSTALSWAASSASTPCISSTSAGPSPRGSRRCRPSSYRSARSRTPTPTRS
jgi:threonyl-tRNA synthetase